MTKVADPVDAALGRVLYSRDGLALGKVFPYPFLISSAESVVVALLLLLGILGAEGSTEVCGVV